MPSLSAVSSGSLHVLCRPHVNNTEWQRGLDKPTAPLNHQCNTQKICICLCCLALAGASPGEQQAEHMLQWCRQARVEESERSRRRALQREQGLRDRKSTLRSGGPSSDSACQSSSAQGSTLSSITMLGRKRFMGSGSGIFAFRSFSDDCA